ncbi:MAG: T9SS type A sorting domain-containing protein [Flavobacteriales bacterium]|nr:T9SS type A sorting domain-containing protein [Flavobacteriales bacterium]
MRPILIPSLLFSASLFAQQLPFCGTNEARVMEQLHHNDPTIVQAIADADAELEAFTASYPEGERSTYTVPVVFHIIHNNGPENISDEQVWDAMRILNEDFNKQNPDWPNVQASFLPIVANVSIEFKLARKDPQGNCTNGITRTVSTLTNDGTQTMKDLIQWPRNKYLNVWVAASADGAAGYTLIPAGAAFFPEADGIVMLHSYVGAIGTSSVSRSRALTHEVGHWINLEHTWGQGNPGETANCSDSDNVSDTPPTAGWVTCNLTGNTCTAPIDNVENFMEYSYCSKMFTNGQSTRMIASLNSSTAQRNQIIATGNLTATGVNQPEALCAVVFSGDQRVICAGGSITFNDDSYNAVTSRTWTFAGGSPGTSTDETPTVTYADPGVYAVALTASDGTTTLTNTQATYVTVLAAPGITTPAVEGFETVATLTGPEWFTNNQNSDNTFGITSVAAYSGSKSTRIVNTAAMDGRLDELVSTTYDLSAASSVLVSFRYAYAKRTSTSDDVLRFYISNDCGNTWALRKIMRGSTNLTTGGTTSSSFIPNGQGQWGYAEVTNIGTTSLIPNFRFKFEFESDGGNNLYLDDINLNGAPVGVEELAASSTSLLVMPNPASDEAQVQFSLTKSGVVQLDLLDMTGRLVHRVHSGSMAVGMQRLDLPVRALQAGLYFIRLQQGGMQEVGRFVVR